MEQKYFSAKMAQIGKKLVHMIKNILRNASEQKERFSLFGNLKNKNKKWSWYNVWDIQALPKPHHYLR